MIQAYGIFGGIDRFNLDTLRGLPQQLIRRGSFALFDGDVFLDMDLFCRNYKNDEAFVIICETKYVTPKSFFSGHETLTFETMPLRTPKNPEDYLESLYGADWRQPRNGLAIYHQSSKTR